jgi:hypothetical protein
LEDSAAWNLFRGGDIMPRMRLCHLVYRSHIIVLALLVILTTGWAQERAPRKATAQRGPLPDSVGELEAQVRELQSALLEMRAEMASYRAEALRMRRELQATQDHLASGDHTMQGLTNTPETSPSASTAPENNVATLDAPKDQSGDQRLVRLEEEYQLLSGKIDEQYQTKVESASKYRVRLSGIVLLNVFNNRGAVDNADFPTLAVSPGPLDSGGSFGGTLRQSQLGLEVFGAQFKGAKASADLQLDFSGGFPNTLNGVTLGLVRLRTATLRLDWPRTSIVAGQDALFFSPLSPTSLASLAVPALSYAGNLWAWVPQVRAERRLDLSADSSITLQAGILDPLVGEPPLGGLLRTPQPGERSRQPGYATRVAWTHGPSDRRFTLGAGGYYSRQNWGFGRNVDGWAGMADWDMPLGRWFSFAGKFYRGRAVGGLSGAFGRSVLTTGPLIDRKTSLLGLNSMGGWGQLKFKPTATLEFNAASGQENPLTSDFRRFPPSQGTLYPSAVRNRSSLVNLI